MTGARAGHRADHEVHPRRLDRDRRDGGVLRADAGASGRHYDRVSAELVAGETDAVLPSRNHAIVLVSTLHKPTLRALAYARATRPGRAGGGHGQRRRRRHQAADARLGQAQAAGAAQGRRVAVPGDHQAGARLRQADPHRTTRATSSPCSSRSTSWATGGSRSCTTRARCGSRAGCCSSPGVMVTSVPWQLRVVRAGAAPAAGDRRPGRRGAAYEPVARRRPRGAGVRRGAPRWQPRRGPTRIAPAPALGLDRPDAGARRRPGRARRALRGPVTRGGWCSSGTRCRASGCAPWSPRTAAASFCRADAVAVLEASPRPGAGAVRVGPGRRLRRLRLAARRPGRAARAEGRGAGRAAAPARRDRAGRARSRSCPAGRWAGGTGCGWPSTSTAGPGCARTAATTCCRSRTARWRPPAPCPPVLAAPVRAGRRGRGGRRRRRRRARRRRGRARSVQRAAGREWRLSPGVFWQVHPALPDALAAVVGGVGGRAAPAARRGTSTAGSGCSPRCWPGRSGRTGR